MAVIKIDNLGTVGIISDVAPSELSESAFNSARNIAFRNGNVEPCRGYSAIYTPFGAGVACGLLMMRTPDALTRRVFFCTPTQIWKYTSATAATDYTRETASVKVPYTGTIYNKWTNFAFNGFAYFNNGVDEPQVYVDVAAYAPVLPLPGWTSTWRAKSLRPYKNAIIAMNMTEAGVNFPHLLRFSDTAAPGAQPASWTALPTNKAGSVPMAESQGGIVDGLQLGDAFIIYKQDSYYRMTFIGGNDVYRIQKINNCPGLLAPNCVVQYPGGHFCLGANLDVYVHNGGDYKSVLQGRRKENFRNALWPATKGLSFVTVDAERRECIVCFVGGSAGLGGATSCDTAWCWNWEEDTWSERDIPSVNAGTSGQLDNAILADPDTEFMVMTGQTRQPFVFDAGLSFNGVAPSRFVRRDGLHFGDQLAIKTVRSFTPNIVGTSGDVFSIAITSQYNVDGPITSSASYNFILGTSVQVPVIKTGRYLGYNITYTGANIWKLRSVQFEVEPRGRY